MNGGLAAMGFGAAAGAVTSFIDSAYGNAKDVMNGKKRLDKQLLEPQ